MQTRKLQACQEESAAGEESAREELGSTGLSRDVNNELIVDGQGEIDRGRQGRGKVVGIDGREGGARR